MSPQTRTQPTGAQRIRTACAHAAPAMLATPGYDPVAITLVHLRLCGDAILAVPTGAAALSSLQAAGADGESAVLELTDHAPLALRETVRALVWLRGHAYAVPSAHTRELADSVAAEYPHPALLDVGHTTSLVQLRIDAAILADTTGTESVCPDQLRRASPDPFWELEAHWLRHLDADHPDVVDQLVLRHAPSLRRSRVRPLAIDQYGITLRAESGDGDHDVRLNFAAPATDAESLSKAFRLLLGCPFANGLRSRA